MKIVIFAGGTGRRLWPISRQKSPKQFEAIIGDKSTLQLAVDRVFETYGPENIFISTNERYLDIVRQQLPQLPETNFIGEPARRDLAAAVGLSLAHLVALDTSAAGEAVAILWGDNYMENVPNFLNLMATAETLLQEEETDILFIGETPRFANEHLGWLGLGEQLGTNGETPYYRFTSLTYRPPKAVCQQMFDRGTHVWNTGYFVTTPGYVLGLYQQYQSAMWAQLAEIQAAIGREDYQETLHRIYPTIEVNSFDEAILAHVDPQKAVVLHSEMGWSDPGTLYALKEAINADVQANVVRGLVIDEQSRDSLIYNYETGRLVVAVGLEGMVVVNTEDALLVVHKDQIPLVKQVVNGLDGTDLESFS